jgi:GGDEF domain-containing protein
LPPSVPLNPQALDLVFQSLTHPGTGFLTYNAFMFFVVREFSHFQRSKLPFAAIGFEFYLETPDGHFYPLPSEYINEAGQRLFAALRPLDWLAHYDQNDFAMLLPHTTVNEALQMAEWLQGAISASGPLTGMEGATPLIVCGIAGLPDDCEHPGILLAAAYEAKNRGKQMNIPISLYRDLTA